jgi:hypothetical protein
VIDLRTLAAAWWVSDGTTPSYDQVDDIVRSDHELLPSLIAALAATAPTGALEYIGTTVVEDLAIMVREGDLADTEAIRLMLASQLTPAQLFSVLSGAYADLLLTLDGLCGTPLSSHQVDWLLDEHAPNRRPREGQTIVDGDDLRFVPGQTPWQEHLQRQNADDH